MIIVLPYVCFQAGHIHLAKRSPLLDSEQNEKLTLVVEAKDRGTPAKLVGTS